MRHLRDALLTQRVLIVGLRPAGGNGFPSGFAHVSLPHISSIEPLASPKRKGA